MRIKFIQNLLDKLGIKIGKHFWIGMTVTNSHQYYLIVIENGFPLNRDKLFEKYRENNIFVRKNLYPACSDFDCYKDSKKDNLDILNNIKNRVLSLAYYGSLKEDGLNEIIKVMRMA